MKRIALVGNGVTGKRIAKRLDLIAPDCDVVAVDPRGTLAEAARLQCRGRCERRSADWAGGQTLSARCFGGLHL